jgi:hypothetical protein
MWHRGISRFSIAALPYISSNILRRERRRPAKVFDLVPPPRTGCPRFDADIQAAQDPFFDETQEGSPCRTPKCRAVPGNGYQARQLSVDFGECMPTNSTAIGYPRLLAGKKQRHPERRRSGPVGHLAGGCGGQQEKPGAREITPGYQHASRNGSSDTSQARPD